MFHNVGTFVFHVRSATAVDVGPGLHHGKHGKQTHEDDNQHTFLQLCAAFPLNVESNGISLKCIGPPEPLNAQSEDVWR